MGTNLTIPSLKIKMDDKIIGIVGYIILALGHSGYIKDQKVAAKVPHLDVVVGAHSHSFLFTPTSSVSNPSINPIRGPYPTLIDNPVGHKTLVLQAYAFTKYLGQMK